MWEARIGDSSFWHLAVSIWRLGFVVRLMEDHDEGLQKLGRMEPRSPNHVEAIPCNGKELFGLTSQIRRCSASIGANIAEGCGRRGNGEFHRFLQIASGSASELDYHLLLARDLSLISEEIYRPMNSELGSLRRKLTTLILKVDTDRHEPNANCQMPTAIRND
jgi:four helix bundle protein